MMSAFFAELGSNVYAAALTLFLFGLTIFVHELGHFLVARWCGLQVDAFSIGFGPSLWQRKIKGVVYKIGILPLGGYVALPQLDPTGGNPHKTEGGAAEAPRALPRVGPLRKIAVSLAGVTCNMILAIILAYVVFWNGKSFAPEKTNLVGYVDTNSTAYADGFRLGDEIVDVNGRKVRSWEDFILGVSLSGAATVSVVRADGSSAQLLPQTRELMGGRYVHGLSMVNYCLILKVLPGTGAARAGLKAQDTLVTFDGQKLYSQDHLRQLVSTRAGQAVPATILRKGQSLSVELMPQADPKDNIPRIGVEFNSIDVSPPFTQIRSHASIVFSFLKALVTPRHAGAAAKQVGGPVKIFEVMWISVKASFILALWFTVMLNVNLAIMNLLPLPVLDGGHIVLSLWELLTRRTVSPKVVNILWNSFAALLLATIAYISFRDVRGMFNRGPKGGTNELPPAVSNAVPPAASNAAPGAAATP